MPLDCSSVYAIECQYETLSNAASLVEKLILLFLGNIWTNCHDIYKVFLQFRLSTFLKDLSQRTIALQLLRSLFLNRKDNIHQKAQISTVHN